MSEYSTEGEEVSGHGHRLLFSPRQTTPNNLHIGYIII